ncbi:MAG: hypothetical protein WAU00_21940 [Caldilinea sp.]|uniref:hypothetical protein n=1 Tax=Caldilinea sp. TaxID=2293560 RepID=UPI002B5ADA28|nr:hypothetical protein [Anaerolineales bacterium]HQY91228.1 hypothetical protein [Caldilinea sp.]
MSNRSISDPDQRASAYQDLLAELAEVEHHLHTAIANLFPPFSQMVAAQLRNSQPRRRAAVVLTAGVAAPDNETVRSQRVLLGAALEMLHLAITVHMILADSESSDTPNRSLLGSTILAGDYCFSRSASLAVRTGNSTVVEIFSDALKRVSEGRLRNFFDPSDDSYNEDQELFVAGATAAMHLAHTPAHARSEVIRFVAEFAHLEASSPARTLASSLADVLDAYQSDRWLALLGWQMTNNV